MIKEHDFVALKVLVVDLPKGKVPNPKIKRLLCWCSLGSATVVVKQNVEWTAAHKVLASSIDDRVAEREVCSAHLLEECGRCIHTVAWETRVFSGFKHIFD